jgi:hypothetical protein
MLYDAKRTLTFLRNVFRQKIAEEHASIEGEATPADEPAAETFARRQASERKISEMETRVSKIDSLLSEDQ